MCVRKEPGVCADRLCMTADSYAQDAGPNLQCSKCSHTWQDKLHNWKQSQAGQDGRRGPQKYLLIISGSAAISGGTLPVFCTSSMATKCACLYLLTAAQNRKQRPRPKSGGYFHWAFAAPLFVSQCVFVSWSSHSNGSKSLRQTYACRSEGFQRRRRILLRLLSAQLH